MVGAATPLPLQNAKGGILVMEKVIIMQVGIRVKECIGRWTGEVAMGLQTKRYCTWSSERCITAHHRWGVVEVGGGRLLPLPLLVGRCGVVGEGGERSLPLPPYAVSK